MSPACEFARRPESGVPISTRISTRKILAALAIASAAFTLAACGPDDPAADGTGSPSAEAGGSAAPKAPKATAAGEDHTSCPTLAPGHSYIWVDNVEGAMNNVIAREAKASCDPTTNEGAAYHPVGAVTTYTLSLSAKITVIGEDGPETRGATQGPRTGIAHVKSCADPNGDTWDGGQAEKPEEFCYGQNFYDVVLDGSTITEMTEVYGS